MAGDSDILTIAELSRHLRVHPTTIYRLLRQGRIPGFRVGSAWRFNKDAIEKWEHAQGRITDLETPQRGRRARNPQAARARK
ncbi:MAG TPA: helix-turn-helix domain-containing protein [Candidatus Binataceae bacterium]|nr:helix-turn-helix domain-containing protein [Candidatus Binataceae bacterium]